MQWLFAQAAGELGISVPVLIGGLATILGAVVAPLVTAIVKISNAKDAQNSQHLADKQAQAEAHRVFTAALAESHLKERLEFLKLVREERERNERQAEARARDATEARVTLADVSTTAMRTIDGWRSEALGVYTTPTDSPSPPQRDTNPGPPPMLSQNPSGAPARKQDRGRRNSNA